ncbi:PREDICTED: uncharacterized protein LOC104716607 [Camelina sativa]|uniref:Uncharacterized protein LOC104716607 n=1 Tax=Camelina sativa TaxID=90675 RepID=A0ABM0TW23_CAMSA|nr:PREDICTED: uncharacterized protein LOC104716607 [Camelina sativa]
MMKHTQTILAKFCGRAYSTIASSPLSSSVNNGWKEQDCLVLYGLFRGGYFTHGFKNVYKRREHWHKVDRMQNEHVKLSKELYDTSERYRKAIMQALKEERKSRP